MRSDWNAHILQVDMQTVLLLSENSGNKHTSMTPKASPSYSRQTKAHAHTKTCTLMYIMALSIIAPNQKQPKRPSEGEGLNKPWHIHAMESSSTIKKQNIDLRRCAMPGWNSKALCCSA